MYNNAIVGHTGFVGSNLCAQTKFTGHYNSKTIETIRGQKFDRLVFAGAQAKKWWANENSKEDWRGIKRALDALADVSVNQAVLISTVDVVPPGAEPDEAADCSGANHPYGTNRLALERAFREMFERVLIVRLPGLFGLGLRKNVIFDLLTDNLLAKINPSSRFQYYDLGRLWPDIERGLAAELPLIHLVTEPVSTDLIIERFFPGKVVGSDPAPTVIYDLRTRYAEMFSGARAYIEDADSVLKRMQRFLLNWQAGEARDDVAIAAR